VLIKTIDIQLQLSLLCHDMKLGPDENVYQK